jgi:hypothetical protein
MDPPESLTQAFHFKSSAPVSPTSHLDKIHWAGVCLFVRLVGSSGLERVSFREKRPGCPFGRLFWLLSVWLARLALVTLSGLDDWLVCPFG